MASINDFLFIRRGEVIVGPRVSFSNGPVVPQDAIKFGSYLDSQGLLRSGLRIKFEIGKSDGGESNKAKIMIYNISPESRSFLEKKQLVLFLNVGYAQTMRNVFFADVKRVEDKREGPDVITTIECGDAENAIRESFVSIGLGPGCTNFQLFNEAIKVMNLPVVFKTDFKEITFNQGYTFAGLASKLLDTLCNQVNINWSVQDGELMFTASKQTDNIQTEAPLISSETGLLNIPTKDEKGIKFECLINPEIRPNRAVVVQSASFQDGEGVKVKVLIVEISGDTHEGDWKYKIESEVIT